MDVYITPPKPEKVTKVQSTPKEVLARDIAEAIQPNMNGDLFTDQLSKAGKQALQNLAAHFGFEFIA